MTTPLYYDDPDLLTFDAHVVAVDPATGAVELDRTAFYPEGGGQPGDRGVLVVARRAAADAGRAPDGAAAGPASAQVTVSDTQKRDGRILHLTDGATPLAVGDAVTGRIDGHHRLEYMQQHSGQHLLSAILYREFGAPTVAVAQGDEVTTIEVEHAPFTDAELAALERRAADEIAAGRSITMRSVDDAELATLPLRRPTQRTGTIRLVEIDALDRVACGGVHLRSTAEVRAIFVAANETIRGHQRIAFWIGERALARGASAIAVVERLARAFSSHRDEVEARVAALEQRRIDAEGLVRDLADRAATALLEAREGHALSVDDGPDELFEACARSAAESCTPDRPIVVVTRADGARLLWAIAFHPAVTPAIVGQDGLRERVLAPLGARGGGKPPLWRGVIDTTGTSGGSQAVGSIRRALEERVAEFVAGAT